jgi:hypothetical protein
MILLDLQQLMYSNLSMSLYKLDTTEINEDLLRHMLLNSIRSNYQKFKTKFGKLVIATDSKTNWRKDIFPYYKFSRQKTRNASKLDWPGIFKIMHQLREEITENFPYPVINIDNAEGDDIIGVLALNIKNEPILIVSSDKDFCQLHSSLISQYDPIRKRKVETTNPMKFLKEHIIRGDSGDGIPNIMSKDDCFILGHRQRNVSSKKLEKWLLAEPEDFCDSSMFRNFKRNEVLIDLKCIPKNINDDVLSLYDKQLHKDKGKIFKYFIDKRLKNLMEVINEF